ncbi:TorD/DmsD family molecular chaperone [Necropsobacter massiliensis]|uniref:TorD/DmsD family molecular chaperone n=1 Tax=Necropsobacter massiliensis TaxID=1400001 RepID=UPI00059591D8|nr:molecular chaperone [Necropsobacter massiliensis]
MTTAYQLNNFSLISRLFGNLFYRAPTDPVLAETFIWLQQKGLSRIWALDTDKQSEQALDSLQMPIDLTLLDKEYQRLFGGENPLVDPRISAYGLDVSAFIDFRTVRAMPPVKSADHFALVFLTASWIEDNLDSVAAQRTLFERFLLPCAAQFLTSVETNATLPFYRSLALLSKAILSAMADELEESETV